MKLSPLLTLLLVAAFWWQGERFLAANGPTFDEPVHFAAGYSYWATGDFRLNLEDPPLAKLLWTLPQFLFDPLPFPAEWRTENEWRVGHALLFDSGHDWKALLTPARRMNMLFGVGVVVLVGVFARRLFDSPASGVVASALAAFDPNLVAHSCVLSTDVSLTFCTLLTAWLGWEYVRGPRSRVGLTGLGIAVGLTLGAKFSAVLVVGALGVGLLAVLMAGGVVTMPGVSANPVSEGDRVRLALPVVMRVALVALLTLLPLYFVVGFPAWGEGLKYQLLRGDSGDKAFYLLGEVSSRGWWWYFAVALAVKLPVGVLVLGVLGLASRPSDGAGSSKTRPITGAARLFLPVCALSLFILISAARVNLGVRVMLPVIPFLYLLAGRFVARPSAWRYLLAALAVGSVMVSAVRTSPYPLSYFNEFVGGPERGVEILGDSNLDWGQGLPALKEYMDREGLESVCLSYCGTAPPRAFGIRCEPLTGHGQLEPPVPSAITPNTRRVLVVSASNLQGTYLKDPQAFAWLRDRRPTAILAGCLWVFELVEEDEAEMQQVRVFKP